MINPKLVTLHISYEDWGDNPDDFLIHLEAFIGPEDEPGTEVFYFSALSPKRLVRMIEDDIELGRGLLISSDFNLPKIETKIRQLLTNCHRDNWDETIKAIWRYARWESES